MSTPRILVVGASGKMGARTTTFPVWQQLEYARDVASGLGKLDPIDSARYASVKPRSVRDLLQSQAR